MLLQQWAQPCGNHCTRKYAALTQIPWRVFCKKGCDADGETWEERLSEWNEICYKDPVLKFEIEPEKVDKIRPNRPCKPPPPVKLPRVQKPPPLAAKPGEPTEDIPGTSA